MRHFPSMIIAVIGMAMGWPALAESADLYPAARVATPVYIGCKYATVCDRAGCTIRHICRTRCPVGDACSSLYGAYGPYGGTRYWGAYTAAGWGYR